MNFLHFNARWAIRLNVKWGANQQQIYYGMTYTRTQTRTQKDTGKDKGEGLGVN